MRFNKDYLFKIAPIKKDMLPENIFYCQNYLEAKKIN